MFKFLTYKNIAIVMAVATVVVSALLFLNMNNRRAISSDGNCYYSILPAIFIDQDISFNKRYQLYAGTSDNAHPEIKVCTKENPLCNEYLGFLRAEANGTWSVKCPLGLSVVMSPYFFVADGIVQLTGGVRDGISPIYQYAIALCTIVFFQLAMFLTYKVLRHRFSEKVSLITLLIFIFGTNILHYAVFEPSFTHVYSYTFITATIYLADLFNRKPSNKLLLLIGVCIGFITLIRNLNIIAAVIPFFLIMSELKADKRLKMLCKLALFWGIATIIVMIPQMAYWYISSGNIITYGYQNEWFDFTQPHFIEVLFHLESNGLFFWHPILLLILPGGYLWLRAKDKLAYIALPFLIIFSYLIASWWAFWFGFSFGHRAFTDYLIIFIIPIAYVIERLLKSKLYLKVLFALVIIFLLLLNLIQMNNYWRGIVDHPGLNWETYKENFFDINIDSERRLKQLYQK